MPILKRDARHEVTFTLNGGTVTGYAEPRLLLSDFLRHEIGATGTHVGCEHGKAERQLRARVGVAQRSTDGASVARLEMADVGQRSGEQR